MFGKEVFPATEFAVGVFPTFSRLRAAAKRGNDDEEPDAFWFFHNGSVVMQVYSKGRPRGQICVAKVKYLARPPHRKRTWFVLSLV